MAREKFSSIYLKTKLNFLFIRRRPTDTDH